MAVYCTFLFKEIGLCTILSENHQEGEQTILIDIRVHLNANNRIETDVSDEPLFLRKSSQLAVYRKFLFKEIGLCTILSENHQEGEQTVLIDIRVLLNANNRTETDVSDEPLFFRKSSQLAVYRTFLFKEIIPLLHFIGKSPRGRSNHFHGY